MEMQISGVSGVAVEPEPRRRLPALPTNWTAEPRSTRHFRFMTAMGDLRRSKRRVCRLRGDGTTDYVSYHDKLNKQVVTWVSRLPQGWQKVCQTSFHWVRKQSPPLYTERRDKRQKVRAKFGK